MKVFYRPELATSRPDPASPSAHKPALVVADWLRRGLIAPDDVLGFEPVTRDDFKLAHDPRFVDDIYSLRHPNGYGNVDPELLATLPYTTGSLLAAAHHALAAREAVCSPTSGYHHAHHGFAGGFCTFNGLIVTALKLHQAGLVQSVGILDLDVHYGDGTDELIRHHRLDWIIHETQGRHFHTRADIGRHGAFYFEWLEQALDRVAACDLVLYQASADPHVRDPLGGLLDEGELQRRDQTVFSRLRGRPLVWNLAGGYQLDPWGRIDPVLRLHRNTARACLSA